MAGNGALWPKSAVLVTTIDGDKLQVRPLVGQLVVDCPTICKKFTHSTRLTGSATFSRIGPTRVTRI